MAKGNPSLNSTLAAELTKLPNDSLHAKPSSNGDGKVLADCPHNATLLLTAVRNAMQEAGYISAAMVVNAVVFPVIERSPAQCAPCAVATIEQARQDADREAGEE